MAIPNGHKKNFSVLQDAFKADRVALMECQLAATGEQVAVVCAVNVANGQYEFVPFAMLFNDNPYEVVNPPNPDGGFFSQEEVRQE